MHSVGHFPALCGAAVAVADESTAVVIPLAIVVDGTLTAAVVVVLSGCCNPFGTDDTHADTRSRNADTRLSTADTAAVTVVGALRIVTPLAVVAAGTGAVAAAFCVVCCAAAVGALLCTATADGAAAAEISEVLLAGEVTLLSNLAARDNASAIILCLPSTR